MSRLKITLSPSLSVDRLREVAGKPVVYVVSQQVGGVPYRHRAMPKFTKETVDTIDEHCAGLCVHPYNAFQLTTWLVQLSERMDMLDKSDGDLDVAPREKREKIGRAYDEVRELIHNLIAAGIETLD